VKRIRETDLFHLSWIASLVLTFAPFYPRPHIVVFFKKIQNGQGIGLMYFDIVLHFLPLLCFIILLIRRVRWVVSY